MRVLAEPVFPFSILSRFFAHFLVHLPIRTQKLPLHTYGGMTLGLYKLPYRHVVGLKFRGCRIEKKGSGGGGGTT